MTSLQPQTAGKPTIANYESSIPHLHILSNTEQKTNDKPIRLILRINLNVTWQRHPEISICRCHSVETAGIHELLGDAPFHGPHVVTRKVLSEHAAKMQKFYGIRSFRRWIRFWCQKARRMTPSLVSPILLLFSCWNLANQHLCSVPVICRFCDAGGRFLGWH